MTISANAAAFQQMRAESPAITVRNDDMVMRAVPRQHAFQRNDLKMTAHDGTLGRLA
jgi:hypothetical protein